MDGTPLPAPPPRRTLVAGVGNIFLGDDGFGSEVARRLAGRALPAGVRVVDYGIRGTDLVYDLLDGWDRLVLVDTVPERGEPGALHVIEVDPADLDAAALGAGGPDPHGMDPTAALAGVTRLGGELPPTTVLGCEPAAIGDAIGLSPEVEAAVASAVDTVERLVAGRCNPVTSGPGSR